MNRLKEMRVENGYTQKQLSELLNTKQTIYSRYERGSTPLNIDLLKKLCVIYNISADYILELTDEKRPLK
ncbi:MAG: helix-turn-helix transcriptional regulator [Clostridia bacterium]|nr:helix-turn-helix transcriptional regulator [Clostridia bacterium]